VVKSVEFKFLKVKKL